MKKLQVIRSNIFWTIYEGDAYTSNTSIHTAPDVRTLNEEASRASAKLYQRVRQYDNLRTPALGNYDNTCTILTPEQSEYYING
jgi:hypothetical protein